MKKLFDSVFVHAALAVFLFGCVPVSVRVVSADPYTIGIFRMSVGVLCLGVILLAKTRKLNLLISDIWPLIFLGTCFALHWLTYFWSIKKASASLAAVGLATYGIHLIVLGCLIRKEAPKLSDVLGVGLAFIGTVLNVPEFSLESELTLGLLLGISSGFFYAVLPFIHQRNTHIPGNIRTLGQLGFALLWFCLFLPQTKWQLSSFDWAILVFLGLGCTVVAHSLWVKVTTELSTQTTSVVYYGYVFVSMFLAYMLLDEVITLKMLIGAVMVVVGIYIALDGQRKRGGLLSGA